jgi:hypothetical protein
MSTYAPGTEIWRSNQLTESGSRESGLTNTGPTPFTDFTSKTEFVRAVFLILTRFADGQGRMTVDPNSQIGQALKLIADYIGHPWPLAITITSDFTDKGIGS